MTTEISLGDAAAVVGIAAGIIVILSGAAKLVQLLLKRRRRNESPPERRSELAEECAVALVKVKAAIDGAWLGVLQWGQGWAKQEPLRMTYEGLRAEGLALIEQLSRVRVIFGCESRAAGAFKEAADAAEEVYNALQRIARERDDGPSDEHAARQVQTYFEEGRAKIERARERFAEAQARFEGAVS